MTIQEKENILKNDFKKNWLNLWGKNAIILF